MPRFLSRDISHCSDSYKYNQSLTGETRFCVSITPRNYRNRQTEPYEQSDRQIKQKYGHIRMGRRNDHVDHDDVDLKLNPSPKESSDTIISSSRSRLTGYRYRNSRSMFDIEIPPH